MSKDVKEILKQHIDDVVSGEEATTLRGFISNFPTCGVGIPLELEEIKEKRARKKRAPSAYNQFIGKCMKAKKIKKFGEASGAMKACALEWRKTKGGR